MNIEEQLAAILINLAGTTVAKEGEWYEAGNITQAIAKVKALVVESLPKEKQIEFVKSLPTVALNDEDRCRFYRYGGYDFAIREIRSIYEGK